MCKTTGAVMKTSHKHAVVIKAWADGADIQVRIPGSEGANEGWRDCSFPSFDPRYEYRIKPEKKSLGQLFFEACEREQWGEQGPNCQKCYEGYAKDFLKAMKEQE